MTEDIYTVTDMHSARRSRLQRCHGVYLQHFQRVSFSGDEERKTFLMLSEKAFSFGGPALHSARPGIIFYLREEEIPYIRSCIVCTATLAWGICGIQEGKRGGDGAYREGGTWQDWASRPRSPCIDSE